MTEEIVEQMIEPKKETRGRPRKSEEEKKKYIPKPRNTEPREKLKAGRKKGQITNPDRYTEDGKYITKPNDPEYFKKYYLEVIKVCCTCPICGITISTKQKLKRHQASQYCMMKQRFKDIPNIETILPPLPNDDE